MPDQSHLDERYFVDEHAYNCPFCNRRHVSYSIDSWYAFDWTHDKKCHVYFVHCHSCRNVSMHLSYRKIDLDGNAFSRRFSSLDQPIDDYLFYSVPTSFFVLDPRVPRVLRELLTEAEGSLKSNFLTGASACARKIVYELAKIQKVDGRNYEDRVKALKDAHPKVDPAYFDTLVTIQQVTSSKVHENAYDGWNSQHLRVILSSLREVLHELYVTPVLRADRRESILKLKDELLTSSSSDDEGGETT